MALKLPTELLDEITTFVDMITMGGEKAAQLAHLGRMLARRVDIIRGKMGKISIALSLSLTPQVIKIVNKC